MKKNKFESERLLLRRIQKNDKTNFYEIMGNDNTMKYLGKVLSHDEIGGFIGSISNNEYNDIYGEYAIVLKEENKVIGMFSITYKKRDKRAEVSYMLNSNYWRKGFASEIAIEVISVLFIEEKVNKVTADCDNMNNGSIALLNKLGMTQEGLLKQERFSKILNSYYDVRVFGLLFEKYKNLK